MTPELPELTPEEQAQAQEDVNFAAEVIEMAFAANQVPVGDAVGGCCLFLSAACAIAENPDFALESTVNAIRRQYEFDRQRNAGKAN